MSLGYKGKVAYSMTEKLFSYGTLQIESVQLDSFDRKLIGQPDVLLGYEIRDFPRPSHSRAL